jgi:hypothetical protein
MSNKIAVLNRKEGIGGPRNQSPAPVTEGLQQFSTGAYLKGGSGI